MNKFRKINILGFNGNEIFKLNILNIKLFLKKY